MRMLGTLIISLLCAGATATPVCALEELQDCDAIKDTGNRMACLQAHISHLEQTLLSINTELVDIRHELKVKLASDEVYKLQYVGKGSCLGFADNDKPPVFATCDRPDSWKLVRGSQLPGKTTNAPKPESAPPEQLSGNPPAQPSDNAPGKPKGQGKSVDKQQGKATDQPQGKSSSQPKTVPQPN